MLKLKKNLQNCDNCTEGTLRLQYKGDIRNGDIGDYIHGEVFRCSNCNIVRLAEKYCMKHNQYEDSQYRNKLNEQISIEHYTEQHQSVHELLYKELDDSNVVFRDRIILDVGCGAGTFSKRYEPQAKRIIGIEPDRNYRKLIKLNGGTCYANISDFYTNEGIQVDIVLLNQVIEHVEHPLSLVKQCLSVLKNEGIAIITTPNLNEVLMSLPLKQFKKHFYRTQHRWYFDNKTLAELVQKLDVKILRNETYHRYDFKNFIKWFLDTNINTDFKISEEKEKIWKLFLNKNFFGDNTILIAQKITVN